MSGMRSFATILMDTKRHVFKRGGTTCSKNNNSHGLNNQNNLRGPLRLSNEHENLHFDNG